MTSNFLKSKLGGALLGISLLFGIGLASSMTAQAQYRNDDYWRQQRQYQRDREREERRRQKEYERAQRRQARDAARYGNNGYGTYDNNGAYGNNGNYGYGNYGYGNNPYYGGSYELRQTALNAGYNEGVKAGRDDRSRGRSYNYADEGTYRSADKDYNSRYGDRGLYQQYFRQGFVNGYTDGYRGY